MLNQRIVDASIELDNVSVRGLSPFLGVVFDIQSITPPYSASVEMVNSDVLPCVALSIVGTWYILCSL